jgi:hypothetical protein
MFYTNIFSLARKASSLTLFIFVILLPTNTLAQQTEGNDKIEAIAKRLEELEKQVKELKQENSELKIRLDEKEKPKLLLAAEKKPALEETPKPAPVQQKPEIEDKEKRLEIGGEIRLRFEMGDNNLFSFRRETDTLIRQRARLHAKAKLTDDITGFIQIQDSRVWGEEFDTLSTFINVDLHQAYIDVNRFLTDSLSLRAGRQELRYGNERLIGAFDWDNNARAFDAIKGVYAKKKWSVDVFAARVEEEEFFFPFYQDFYGGYLKLFNDRPNHKLEFYGLVLRNNIHARGESGGSGENQTTIYTFGTRQEAKSGSGLYYDGEFAFQTGHLSPDPHRAFALAVKAGKYFESARSFHFGLEYDFATGDKNAGDGKSQEFINLFPDNHTHYGYMDFLGWRNMHDFRVNAGFNPTDKFAFDADYHKFLLHSRRGRWSNADGVTLGFSPGGIFGRDIGQEVDLRLTFPYKERINILSGYSVFFPGRFAKVFRGPTVSHFAYLQALISF